MLGLKIFVRVQTFRQAPLARLRNSWHPEWSQVSFAMIRNDHDYYDYCDRNDYHDPSMITLRGDGAKCLQVAQLQGHRAALDHLDCFLNWLTQCNEDDYQDNDHNDFHDCDNDD